MFHSWTTTLEGFWLAWNGSGSSLTRSVASAFGLVVSGRCNCISNKVSHNSLSIMLGNLIVHVYYYRQSCCFQTMASSSVRQRTHHYTPVLGVTLIAEPLLFGSCPPPDSVLVTRRSTNQTSRITMQICPMLSLSHLNQKPLPTHCQVNTVPGARWICWT